MSKETDRQENLDKEIHNAAKDLAELTKQRGLYNQPTGNYGAKEAAELEARIAEAMKRLTNSREKKKGANKG